MNNDKLDSKRKDIQARASELIKQAEEVEKQLTQVLQAKEQIKRNYDAVQGALQLLEELSKDSDEPVEAKLELVKE